MTDRELQKILQSDKQLSLAEVKQIIYELKNDVLGEIAENKYEAGFNNGQSNAFYICLDLLEKVDSLSIGIEKRILVLEHDKRQREIREKVMSIFANMQYGKSCTDPERTAYYKQKLNEIFGLSVYQDTDSVRGENE